MKKTFLFLLSVLMAVVVAAASVKSNLASREISIIGKASIPTAKDYIQDGLIAMWDGIENIGWGSHDSESTVWKDLIGQSDFSIKVGNGHFTDNSFSSDLKNSQEFSASAPRSWSDWSIKRSECIFRVRSYPRPSTGIIICTGHATPGFILCSGTSEVGLNGRIFGYQENCLAEGKICAVSSSGIISGGYINGIAWTNTRSSDWNPGGSSSICLGNRFSGSSASFDGEIFCLRFYSRELTDDEIRHNYAVDKSRFNLP